MFDWGTFLDLAEKLAGESDESCQRSAVSRSYYAAFCSARNFLHDEKTYIPRNSGVDHKKVWDHFQRSSNKDRKRIGQYGSSLKKMRTKADYVNEWSRLHVSIVHAPRKARAILSDLQKL